MVPATSNEAALQFFTEAMRANTSTIDAFRQEAREDRKLLGDIHTRVVRMETQNVAAAVIDLTARVAVLETEKNQRDGSTSTLKWMVEKSPSIATIILAIFAAVVLVLKASGRL